MSNRDRIGRMRAEAAATEKEKAAKAEERAKKAASSPGRKPAAASSLNVRLKVVWGVKDPRGEILSTFPYPRKDLAEAEVKRLRETDGRSYIVAPVKVPMED